MMHVCALAMDLHLPGATSLKSKRSVVRHLVDTSRSRFGVASAEVGHQDQWQRCELAFASVSGSAAHVEQVLDAVERFVWSHPTVEVVSTLRTWLDPEV
jgi:uncharacterized protein YlxP (DUF503 family)